MDLAESGQPAKLVKLWARRVWTLELSLVSELISFFTGRLSNDLDDPRYERASRSRIPLLLVFKGIHTHRYPISSRQEHRTHEIIFALTTHTCPYGTVHPSSRLSTESLTWIVYDTCWLWL